MSLSGPKVKAAWLWDVTIFGAGTHLLLVFLSLVLKYKSYYLNHVILLLVV